MTTSKSTLFVNRFIVISTNGHTAYDETFHQGVNIIRGKNSSGKSTIMNLLFYALGGNYKKWNQAASRCETVMVEVCINGAIITLRRQVTNAERQPMYIYWGCIEDAKTDYNGWQKYPYNQKGEIASYTNVLFDLLNYPEVKSDMYEDTNITMHQVLRLLFVDQESKTDHLFRSEEWDNGITREAIAELLLGIYDNTLYNKRLLTKEINKKKTDAEGELKALAKLYSGQNTEIDLGQITKLIEEKSKLLSQLDIQIKDAQQNLVYVQDESLQIEIRNKLSLLSDIKRALIDKENQCEHILHDIEDSEFFVLTLEKRISDIENSIITRENLGNLPLTYCPQCLSPLPAPESDEVCCLCHQPLDKEKHESSAKRIKQELTLQLKESKKNLETKQNRLQSIIIETQNIYGEISLLQRDIDLLVIQSKPSTNVNIDSLFEQRGALKQEISQLAKQQQIAERYSLLKDEVKEYADQLIEIEEEIDKLTEAQQEHKQIAFASIQKFSAYMLTKDLSRQSEFSKARPEDIGVNFKANSMEFQGNFNFSASSNTYLKNAIRFAIFFSSLKNNFFRYPRFIMCDNIEDKGMEQERSQNFQQLLVDICNKKGDNDYQMIISTSMIKPELNNTDLCVGDDYSEDNKALKL